MPSSQPQVTQIGFSKRFLIEVEPKTYLQLKELSKGTGLSHKVLIRVAMDQWGTKHFKEAEKLRKT